MRDAGWPNLPYLDALRPEPGWRTDIALCSTYSMNLNALVAALLALAGLDDERGSGSKVDLANAIEALRGRARVLVQRGRIGLPAKTHKILGILDQFVREVPTDEAESSWHPKIALARFVPAEGEGLEWRLWLGSRNLTADLSWDAGLVLVGGGRGRTVSGISELGRNLAGRAELAGARPQAVFRELEDLRWEMPEGCLVEEVSLLEGDKRQFPDAPERLDALTIISPFLDGTVVGGLGRWGNDSTHRRVLSTQTELARLAAQKSRPLTGYAEHLHLDAPDQEDFFVAVSGDESTAESDDVLSSEALFDDEEPEQRGLHAKLIYAVHGRKRTLWLGSANATQRGWNGPNAEVIARMTVSEEIGEGLEAFVTNIARTVDLENLPSDEQDELEERLEKARRQVAARWAAVQHLEDGRPVLEVDASPHPDDSEIALVVGVFGQPRIEWPRGTLRLQLPQVSPAEETEFICCELCLGDRKIAWVQHTPIKPPPTEERDRRALARFLDPRTFLLWVRSLLAGDALLDGGGDWDILAPRSYRELREGGPDWWAPTLEEVLKAWARDPALVADVDRKVSRYLDVMLTERWQEYTDDDKKILNDFQETWKVLRSELVEAAR